MLAAAQQAVHQRELVHGPADDRHRFRRNRAVVVQQRDVRYEGVLEVSRQSDCAQPLAQFALQFAQRAVRVFRFAAQHARFFACAAVEAGDTIETHLERR